MLYEDLPKVKSVEGVTSSNLDRKQLLLNTPLVMKGFCDHFPIVKAAAESDISALKYIQQFYSRGPINICILPEDQKGRVFYNKEMTGFNYSSHKDTFGTLTKFLLNEKQSPKSRGLYMPSTDVPNWFPGFDEENNVGINDLNPVKLLWIGNRVRVAAHYDAASNIACCITGRRRFTLFPSDQISNLYPGPLEFAPGGQEISMVDFANPDFVKFPRFKNALQYAQVADLEPGDALFLPAMWWHHVEGLDDVNILYTHWWRDHPDYFGKPTNALLHAVMSIRGLPDSHKAAWKDIFDYYVFSSSETSVEHIAPAARKYLEVMPSEKDIKQLKESLANKLSR